MAIHIRTGTLQEVFQVCTNIPEFHTLYPIDTYETRLAESPKSLILVAVVDEKPVGFKVGYERDADGSFYSWMGGVAQPYRRQGIAQKLLNTMEEWARKEGYHTLRFKTRNSLTPMLVFGLENKFQIYKVSPRESLTDYRVHLQKAL